MGILKTVLSTEQLRWLREYGTVIGSQKKEASILETIVSGLSDAVDGRVSSEALAETGGAALVGVDAPAGGGDPATLQAWIDINDPSAWFESTEQTGTGASQDVAHGLGRTPRLVIVVPTAGHDGAGSAGTQFPTITEGVHDDTNVKVTVTAGAKFKVKAV